MMNVSNIGLKSFEEKLIIYRNFVKILSLGELAIVKTKIVRKKRPACTRLQARVGTILVATPLWRPSGWWIGPHSGGPGGFEASSRPQELSLNSSMASKIRGTAPINNFVWFTQQRRGFDWTAAKTNQCVSRIAKSLITFIFVSQRRQVICSKPQHNQFRGLRFSSSPEQTQPTPTAPPAMQARSSEGPWHPLRQVRQPHKYPSNSQC